MRNTKKHIRNTSALKQERAEVKCVKVTLALILRGRSSNGGWNDKQLATLGVLRLSNGKLPHKWQNDIIGTWITQAAARQFVALKDSHLRKAKPSRTPLHHDNPIEAPWHTGDDAMAILKAALVHD